ncbi:hypothetical protein MPRS_45590 [Mycobacterium paraseoulense]|nr:hypothetical protein MPRS_45590 [Mycobacterium paraseoulense]
MELRQVTGLNAGPISIVREFDESADLLDRKIKIPAASNESHPPHIVVVIPTLTADPPRVGQQTDLFVVANGRRRRPGCTGKLANPEGHLPMVSRAVLTLNPREVRSLRHARE